MFLECPWAGLQENFWLAGWPTPDLSAAPKWLGVERLKRHFSVTAFHLSSRNGATLPQIEMNGVLFAGLLRVARRIKRSLITPVRPSGPSFEAAHNNDFSHRQKNLDHLSYKNHTARKTGGSTSGQFWQLSPRGVRSEIFERERDLEFFFTKSDRPA